MLAARGLAVQAIAASPQKKETAQVLSSLRFELSWAESSARLRGMSRDHILKTLRAHQAELRAAGILHLSIFGSIARGEATSTSDVDLMAEFDPTKKQTLVTLGRLQNRLSEWLGTEVDLSSAAWMRSSVSERAKREAILAF